MTIGPTAETPPQARRVLGKARGEWVASQIRASYAARQDRERHTVTMERGDGEKS